MGVSRFPGAVDNGQDSLRVVVFHYLGAAVDQMDK
jgi:hypothetical protein